MELQQQIHRHDQRDANEAHQAIPRMFYESRPALIRQLSQRYCVPGRFNIILLLDLRPCQGAALHAQLMTQPCEFLLAVEQVLAKAPMAHQKAGVLDARPQIIVLALCGYDLDQARHDYEFLREFPGFDSLPAARAGEIYLVNASAHFARPGPRIIDSIEILAGILHPKEFPEFAFRNTQNHCVAQHDPAAP